MNLRSKVALTTVLAWSLVLLALSAVSAEQLVLEYWHPYGPPWDAREQRLLDEFNKLNPDVKVVPQVVPWDGFFQKLAVAVASGNPPIAAHVWGVQSAIALADMGILADLTPYTQRDPEWNQDDIYPAFLESFLYKGALIGIPTSAQPTSLAWNKEVFRAAGLDPEVGPRDLDELIAFSDKITRTDERGRLDVVGFTPNTNWGGFLNWAYHWGGIFYDEEAGRITASDPVNIRALQWQIDFFKRYGSAEEFSAWQAGFPGGFGGENDPFIKGKLGIHLNSHYHYYIYHTYAPDLEYGFSPPILIDSGEGRVAGPIAHTDSTVVLKGPYEEIGYRLAKFLTLGEGHKEVKIPLTGHPSAAHSVNERALEEGRFPEWLPKELLRQNFEVLAMARPWPRVSVLPQLLDELNAQVEMAHREEKSAEQALRDVDRVVQRLFDRAR